MSLSELFGVSYPGSDLVRRSCHRLADGAAKGGSGNSEAGGNFADGNVGCFEQRANNLDLLGGEFRWLAALAAAGPGGIEAGDGS